MTFENDLDVFIKWFWSQIPQENLIFPEFGYENPALICLDAVLSIKQKYKEMVVPRIEGFQKEYAHINTLQQLQDLILEHGIEGFQKIWRYEYPERVHTLDNLIKFYIEYGYREKLTDLNAMKHWAKKASVHDYRTFGVPGIGVATFQYLRMLLGVSTVKPDVHIKKAVSDALGFSVSDLEAVNLLEKASEKTGIPAITIDNNIWSVYSSKSRK